MQHLEDPLDLGPRAANASSELREANKPIKLLEQENEVLRRAAADARGTADRRS